MLNYFNLESVFGIIISLGDVFMKKSVFYILILLTCVFLTCLSTSYDYDLFARLIVGERFIEHSILPFKDFLSYTPTHTWYDHEWGSGVVFYFMLKYFGSLGLILLQSLLMFGTAFFIIKTQKLQRHAHPASITFMAVFLTLFWNLNSSLIRCQLFSFFFFSMFLYLMEKQRKFPESNSLWIIPPIVIIWNNLHGGVVSGLGLIFLYIIGAIIEKKPFKKQLATLAISAVLLVINPYGYKYLNFLFAATTMNRKYIIEWWSPLHANLFVYYLPICAYLIFGFLSGFRKKFDITKTIVLAVTLYSGLAHIKLLSLAIITVTALCYNDICYFFRFKFLKKTEKALYPAIFVLAILFIPFSSPNTNRVGNNKFPLPEVEFLKLNNIKGNIVVPFGLGSYISYKLYPDNLIFMDGRYEEVYNDKEFLTLRDYELAENNWKDIINNYKTEILMPRKDIEIYEVLKKDPEWTLVYEGYQTGIFLPKNKVQDNYIQPETKKTYYRKNLFIGNTFGKKLKTIGEKSND